MSLFHRIVASWQNAPLSLRGWLVSFALASGPRRVVGRVRRNRLEILELRDRLPSHRLGLHWHTQKAFVFGTYELEVTPATQRTVRPGLDHRGYRRAHRLSKVKA